MRLQDERQANKFDRDMTSIYVFFFTYVCNHRTTFMAITMKLHWSVHIIKVRGWWPYEKKKRCHQKIKKMKKNSETKTTTSTNAFKSHEPSVPRAAVYVFLGDKKEKNERKLLKLILIDWKIYYVVKIYEKKKLWPQHRAFT